MEGRETLEPLRKTGLYAYDSVPRYRATSKIRISRGLGLVDDFTYLVSQTERPAKATGPGTPNAHVRRPLRATLAPALNAELKALGAAGADFIQVDEPSAAIVPGQ